MKKIILATAVASIMAGSMAQVAQAETTMYGKARIFLELGTEDAATDSNGKVADRIAVASYSSRIGWKGSEDLGNGMSAVYQFEVDFDADGDNTGSPFSTRVGYGGLKGDFGQVAIGQQWTPSYVLVRGKHDPMNTTAGGNVYGGGFPVATRTGNAISYINSFGDIKVAAAIVSADSDTLNDAFDAAISIPAGPVSIGLAMAQQDAANTASPTALNIGWADGAISVDLGLFQRDAKKTAATPAVAATQTTANLVTGVVTAGTPAVAAKAADNADDWVSLVVKYNTGGGTIVGQFEDNGKDTQTNLAYNHKLSKKTSLMVEFTSGDVAADETNVGIHINF